MDRKYIDIGVMLIYFKAEGVKELIYVVKVANIRDWRLTLISFKATVRN